MVPFARQSYQMGGDDIARLLMEKGRIQADSAQRSGDIWGNAVHNIGQQVGGAIQQHAEQKKETAQGRAFDALFAEGRMPEPREIIRVLGPQRGPEVAKALYAITPQGMGQYKDRMELARDVARGVLAAPSDKRAGAYSFGRNSLIQNKVVAEEEAPPDYNEDFVRQLANYGAEPGKQGPIKSGPGDVFRDPNTLAVLAENPVAPQPPKKHTVTVPGPGGAPVTKLVTEEELAGGVQAYREPKAPAAAEPLMAIVDPVTGAPKYVPRSQAVGQRPASSREQGRPVVSGDAGKLADYDSSLDDLNALTVALSGKSTGTAAKAGAMLWNPITELTGWGVDAKKTQALIDGVKQVIGKSLEEGVLRKEDEIKYEKILPTIGDHPKVVQSKLEGLWKRIQQKRSTHIDALDDAGYDVTKFRARAPRERAGAPKATPLAPEDDNLLKKYGY